MATTIARLSAELSLEKKGYERGLRDADKQAVAVTRQLTVMAASAVAVTTALGKLAERGDKVAAVSAGFARQVGDQGLALDMLRNSTQGLVSDYELMTQANMALTLGSARSTEEFAKLAEVAQKLGRTLGLDTAFALNSLNVGIARQSRLVLDNLGIIVDVEKAQRNYAAALGVTVSELTEYDKKQAFASEAMRQAEEAASSMGEAVGGAGMAWRELLTEIRNTIDFVGQEANESGGLTRFFEGLSAGMAALRGESGKLRESIRLLFTGLDPLSSGSLLNNEDNPINLEGLTVTASQGGERGRPADPYGFESLTDQIKRMENAMLEARVGAINPLTGGLEDYGDVSQLLSQDYVPNLTTAIEEGYYSTLLLSQGFDAAAASADSLKRATSSLSGVLGTFSSVLGFIPGAGVAAGIVSKIASGVGIFNRVTNSGGSSAPPSSSGGGHTAAWQPVSVVLNGPGLPQLVSEVTVQQGKDTTLRKVPRVGG